MSDIATPEMIAAAWDAWKSRPGWKLGPGPGFRFDDDVSLTSASTHGVRISVGHLRAARKWMESRHD